LTLLGLLGALAVWVSGRGAGLTLAAAFSLFALHQAAGLLSGTRWPLPADPELLAQCALLGGVAMSVLGLYSLRRTTRERDAAEDLHWDSMEVIRGVNEAAARPGASFEDKLARVLELGCARFELDSAVACRVASGAPELLAWRAPETGTRGDALAQALAVRLAQAAEGPRAFEIRDTDAGTPESLARFLGAPARLADGSVCVVAFAGAGAQRFTATDKDLCQLLAQWLRAELELRAAQAAPRVAAAPSAPRSEAATARHDLNRAVLRSETRLRTLVAADATLELALATELVALRPQHVPLETLVESLVVAAHALAPSGALRVETSDVGGARGAGAGAAYATLAVRVRGTSIDADALARVFAAMPVHTGEASGAALPLADVEGLLRRAGGDLSVDVEPGRGAVLTAFLPARAPRAAQPAARTAEPAQL
jgi:hypothetical protein